MLEINGIEWLRDLFGLGSFGVIILAIYKIERIAIFWEKKKIWMHVTVFNDASSVKSKESIGENK